MQDMNYVRAPATSFEYVQCSVAQQPNGQQQYELHRVLTRFTTQQY